MNTIALRVSFHAGHCCGRRYHSWIGLLVPSFPCQSACIAPLSTMKICLREEAFRSDLALSSCGLCPKCPQQLDLTSTKGNKGQQQQHILFGDISWILLANNWKGGFLCLMMGFLFIYGSGSSIVSLINMASSKLYLPLIKWVFLCGWWRALQKITTGQKAKNNLWDVWPQWIDLQYN